MASAPPAESRVLNKYGNLLGIWQKNVTNYGGLLHVTYDHVGDKIIGTELLPPQYPNIFGQLRPLPSFCIEDLPPGNDGLQQHCFSSILAYEPTLASHSCEITMLPPYGDIFGQVIEFRTKCSAPFHHQSTPQHLIHNELGANPKDEFRQKTEQKLSHLNTYMHAFGYNRIQWPTAPPPGSILQPGLFKGDFDCDGVELIMVTYEDANRIKATKITGDQCIPFGQIAFEANLTEATVLREDQQNDIEGLRVAQVLNPQLPPNQLPLQPFKVPDEIEDCAYDVPNMCRARCFGLGQIAYEGYTDPVMISGHLVIFNEDLIGFMYFDIFSFTLFHRVQEKLM